MAELDPFESWPAWTAERPLAEYTRGDGVRFQPGDPVRLCPAAGGEALDLVLAGRTARIAAVEQDVDGRVFLVVTIAEDPGQDLGLAGWTAHRFYFRPDEVEHEPVVPTEGGA